MTTPFFAAFALAMSVAALVLSVVALFSWQPLRIDNPLRFAVRPGTSHVRLRTVGLGEHITAPAAINGWTEVVVESSSDGGVTWR